MSAINIPDMVQVLHAHQLRVVSLDIDLETMAPKLNLIDQLVTERSRILLVASIYSRRFDMAPVITAARRHNLVVVEDSAESFGGFEYLGHPDSDLALFSFGPIKYETSFGGAIVKVRDSGVWQKMVELYESYPVQLQVEYVKKVLKYAFVYMLLNCPRVNKPLTYLSNVLNIDHNKYVVAMLRGFPNRLMEKLRQRPCNALLAMMNLRFTEFDPGEHQMSNIKHEYVRERLPPTAVSVGINADTRNHWLCPVVVVCSSMNELYTVNILHRDIFAYCSTHSISFLFRAECYFSDLRYIFIVLCCSLRLPPPKGTVVQLTTK